MGKYSIICVVLLITVICVAVTWLYWDKIRSLVSSIPSVTSSLTSSSPVTGGAQVKHLKSQYRNKPPPMDKIVDPSSSDYMDTPEEAEARAQVIPFSRHPSELRLPYRERKASCRLSLHSGQRKLLLVEAEFLTNYGHLAKTVVYAGAAPGIHSRLLAKMFPDHHFHLYDPRPFSKRLESVPNITLHQEYFDDNVAIRYSKIPILFMCDIRSGDSSDNDFEDHIVQNMQSQMRWVELAHPVMSLLKFRLPFTPGTTKYLDGEILLQPWAPLYSTECRLVTDGTKTRDYDNTTHEQQMYRHNIAGRLQTYPPNGVTGVPGVDRCYDCTAEVFILNNYITKTNSRAKVDDLMNEISEELSETLDSPPHGYLPNEPLPQRLAACEKEFATKSRPARVYTANKFLVKAV